MIFKKLNFIFLVFLVSSSVFAEEFRILHTNDMHSEFFPSALCSDCHISKTATTIKNLTTENTIIMDAGDFSEGNIHFTADLGRTPLEFLNKLNYNYLTIGNHDWLLGPDFLFNMLQRRSSQKVLCANLDFSKYPNRELANKLIKPYDIVTVNNVRVGVVGVTVYEKIFDIFFEPVKITNPVSAVEKAVKDMKDKVDVIVVLSHNGLEMSKKIAKVKGVNVVVAAHDHKLTKEPIKVGDAIVVEAGAHIEYVGALDIDYDLKNKRLNKVSFTAHKTTSEIEDPEIKEIEENMMNKTLAKYGNDIFERGIGFAEFNIERYGSTANGYESDLSNLASDAYRDFYKTDFAFETAGFIARDITVGTISGGDVFNSFPHVINPNTNKTWTVKKIYIKGEQVLSFLAQGYGIGKLNGILGFSDNVKLVVKPGLGTVFNPFDKVVQSMQINGVDVDPDKYYSAAVTEGMINVFKIYERLFIIKFDYVEAEDSKVEHWKVVRNYINKISPINRINLKPGRITLMN